MRNLNMEEIGFVSGAGDTCDSGGGTSSVGTQTTLKEDLVAAYEGVIAAVVYVAERVASAL